MYSRLYAHQIRLNLCRLKLQELRQKWLLTPLLTVTAGLLGGGPAEMETGGAAALVAAADLV